jgi:hypothetical protein
VDTSKPPGDQELAAWLAARIGAPLDEVERGLDEGTRRRAFVVDELLEAGVAGAELLDFVVRLTGLDEAGARALIAARRGNERPT